MPKRGKVRLAGSGRAEEDNVSLALTKSRVQVSDWSPLEGALVVEVEVFPNACGQGKRAHGCVTHRRETRGRTLRVAGRRPGTHRGSTTSARRVQRAATAARKRGAFSAGSGRRARRWCTERRRPSGVVGGHQATFPRVGVPAQGPVVVGRSRRSNWACAAVTANGAVGGRAETRRQPVSWWAGSVTEV